MTSKILIIGNGFDLYHHLPTRYSDFMFFATEWKAFYLAYERNCGKTGKREQISIPLTDQGELTQEALDCFGHHPYLFKQEHIEYLHQNLQKNTWIQYFGSLINKGLRWVDFEAEIQNALYDTEEYSMKSIPEHVGRKATEDVPERLEKIADIFGAEANTDYINFGEVEVLESYADPRELQTNKERLIEFMLKELDILITCLQYYLDDFVGSIKCDCYSEQIKALGQVDLLNFNYTTTFQTIYGSGNLHEHHPVHGGVSVGNIVLGISDDAFQENYDYIRFQKYFQRIQKRTGTTYRNWLKIEMDGAGGAVYKHVYIMGHSLGLADLGVLKDFFLDKCIADVTIYYHSQKSYEDLVINLVKAFGKEEVIGKMTTGKIVFEQLKAPVIMC